MAAVSFRNLAWDLAKVAIATKNCHWISTPNGDQGREWCHDCGRAMVRHLRRRDRKNREDYILDGGWRTEHDSMPICAGCGTFLGGNLTAHGASQEMLYYEENGLSTRPDVDALYLSEIIDALDDDDKDARKAAIRLGRMALKAAKKRLV